MSGGLPLISHGVSVAAYQSGERMPGVRSPRPYLHPVRTAAGTVVTDVEPADHPWHMGMSLAIQDVDGVNFWGGPTYLRDRGYLDLADHGRTERRRCQAEKSGLAEELEWVGPDGRPRLVEQRTIGASTAGGLPACWALHWSSTLHTVTGRPLRIGSPATQGRHGAGYGGLFWRGPASTRPWQVFTATADGEAAVHGSTASWLACGGWNEQGAAYTLVFVRPDSEPARPWFVRVSEYPGVCSALAFDRELWLPADNDVRVSITVFVADGELQRDAVRQLLTAAGTD